MVQVEFDAFTLESIYTAFSIDQNLEKKEFTELSSWEKVVKLHLFLYGFKFYDGFNSSLDGAVSDYILSLLER